MRCKDRTSSNKVRIDHTTLITETEHKHVGVILQIAHTCESPDLLLDAIRQFLKKWAKTGEGKQANAESYDDFNWGDFAGWSAALREKIPEVLDIQCIYPSGRGAIPR